MKTPPPFATIDLDDAPPAESLEALVANSSKADQVFQLYPETHIENPTHLFGDLWHYPEPDRFPKNFSPGPMTSAPVSVRSMNGALVHPGSGIVFDRLGRVVLESAKAQDFRDPTWRAIAPLVATGAKFAQELGAKSFEGAPQLRTLYANHGGYTVFAHLMSETVTIALIFSRWLRSKQMSLLMPNAKSTAMPDRLLELAGLNPSVQLRAEKDFYWSNGLIVSSTCNAQATWRAGPLHRDFARTVKATVPYVRGKRRLFLTRAGERTTQRRDLINEAALMAALTPLGFDAVNPGLMSSREQVALFSSAECIVAVMGSAWANLVFAEPGTLIVDLLPEHKAAIGDGYGTNMAKSMALPYILILTPSWGKGAGDIDVAADVPLVVDRVQRGLERVKTLGLR